MCRMQNYKACFSMVGKKKALDFQVTFADMQQLHLIRQKVARLLTILKSFHSIICDLEAHSMKLNEARAESVSFETFQGFEMSKAQALTYIRRVEWIASFSDGISTLVGSSAVHIMSVNADHFSWWVFSSFDMIRCCFKRTLLRTATLNLFVN